MASELKGQRVAFLTSNEGVEQVELTAPWQAVKDAGGTPKLVVPGGDRQRGRGLRGRPEHARDQPQAG